jgi:hypothetical protein
VRPGQDSERLPVPPLRLLDEVAIQPIVLLAPTGTPAGDAV